MDFNIFLQWVLQKVLGVINGLFGFILSKLCPRNDQHPELPPGELGYPFIGETIEFVKKGAAFYTERFARYGNIYKTHLFGSPTVRIIGPENIKKVVFGEQHNVTATWPKSVSIILGNGALSSKHGEDHRVQKRIIQQALGHRAVADFVNDIQTVVLECLEEWCDADQLLGYQCCRDLAFRLTGKVVIGMDFEPQQRKRMVAVFKTLVDNIFSLPVNCPGFGFYKGLKAKQELEVKIKELLGTTASSVSVLDVLRKFRDDDILTNEVISDECVELLFAGHHSIASSSCSLLLQLFKHKDVCQKIMEELKTNELAEPSVNDLSYEAIQSLPYIENVAKEILRMFPPVGGGFRKATNSFKLEKFTIPKDWTLVYSIRETHHSSPLFPDWDDFRPERWDELDDDTSVMRFTYLPFGAGSRSCPGEKLAKLSLKIFIIELIRNVSWEITNVNPEFSLLPAPKPTDLLPISFRRLVSDPIK